MQWNLNPSRGEAEAPEPIARQVLKDYFEASRPEAISDLWVLVTKHDPLYWSNDPSVSIWDMGPIKDIGLTANSAAAHLAGTLRQSSQPASLEILMLAYEEGIERCSNEVLVNVVHELKVLMQNQSYQVLEHILRAADFSSLSPEAIVAILRVPSSARSILYEWRGAVVRAKSEMTERGLETDRILEGLL